MNSGSSGAGRKVLAALVLGGRLRLELVQGGRSTGLTDGMLASTCLTGTVATNSGGHGEGSSLGSSGLGSIVGGGRSDSAVNGSERVSLLVTTSESVRRRWRERSHLGGRLVSLGWGVCAE